MAKIFCLGGSHRTGKTTLAQEIIKHCDAECVQVDISVMQAKYGFDSSNQSYSFKKRMVIQEYLLKEFTALLGSLNEDKLYILDRAPTDLIIYTLMSLPAKVSATEQTWIDSYIAACIKLQLKYNVLTMVIQSGIPLTSCNTSASANKAVVEKFTWLYHGFYEYHEDDLQRMFFMRRKTVGIHQRVAKCLQILHEYS